MSVWISDEKLLIFASLISPSKMILFEKKYQIFDTVFHQQMKHLEVDSIDFDDFTSPFSP